MSRVRAPQRSFASDTRTVAAVLATLRTAIQNLPRYAPNPHYAQAVQRVAMLPAWRRQVVEWLMEVSGVLGVEGLAGARRAEFSRHRLFSHGNEAGVAATAWRALMPTGPAGPSGAIAPGHPRSHEFSIPALNRPAGCTIAL